MDIFVVVIVPVDMESYNTKMEGPLGDENEVGGGGKNARASRPIQTTHHVGGPQSLSTVGTCVHVGDSERSQMKILDLARSGVPTSEALGLIQCIHIVVKIFYDYILVSEMSVSEKSSAASSSSSSALTSSSSSSVRDIDPLLKDLNEKKQSFRKNVVSLAAELKEVAETKAKSMEEEIGRLQKSLEERNGQLQASAMTTEKYLQELDGLRSQLSFTQATADASAASAQSAQLQCLALIKELDEKNISLKEHGDRVNRLGEQLDHLQKDLQAREYSQKQLKDEVLRIEHDIMQAVAKAGANRDCELRKILDEVSPKNFEKINKLLIAKDDEIAKLKDEIRIMSAHWKLKTKEMESQLEKHRRADQELKKRVLKLEFCLQEARAQTRKLQRMGERRDKALKELRDQLVTKQQGEAAGVEKQNFWESSGFKIVVSMSMLILVVFSKR
uniref:Nuclear envelope-associated protein 2 n=1 Tax=Vitis vinifera TaxID=29760 RepID=A5BJU0_VITVI|nr:hypothetical protein VITISV_037754 [Vitis vinifera]